MHKKYMSIDLETFSSCDIRKTGAHKYMESPDFQILLFAYSLDFGDVRIVDLAQGEEIPEEVLSVLRDPGVIKTAFNAAYEYNALRVKGYIAPDTLDEWEDTQADAAYHGYSRSLAKASAEMFPDEQDKQKDARGKALIKLFCQPGRKGKVTRPEDKPVEWEEFKKYCRQDVKVESEIKKRLLKHPMPESEWRVWRETERMNRRGIPVDLELASNALEIIDKATADYNETTYRLTDGVVEKATQTDRLKKYINRRFEDAGIDYEVTSVSKSAIRDLEAFVDGLLAGKPEKDKRIALRNVKCLIEARKEVSLSSNKKFQTAVDMTCADGMYRGCLVYYGANTGRWAGRGLQVHNIKKSKVSPEELDKFRDGLKAGRIHWDEKGTLGRLSECIRPLLVAPERTTFYVCDYSAIEARVIAWIAGEQWRLDVFRGDGKIYEASAAKLFDIPAETIVRGHENYRYRAKGKIAELALGYGGSVGALKAFGADAMGLSENDCREIVAQWREASPNIVSLWWELERAAMRAYVNPAKSYAAARGRIVYAMEDGDLTASLPSGRKLYYRKPKAIEGKFGQQLWAENTRELYGGKLTENVIQAIARDVLAEAVNRVLDFGYKPMFHVHDEIITPISDGDIDALNIQTLMTTSPKWAEGLPLNAEGFCTKYYTKE